MLETTGEMAEWSIAAVLKTVELRGSGGSNPSLSAREYINKKIEATINDLWLFYYHKLFLPRLLKVPKKTKFRY